jgi:hypothetical protein
MLFVKDIEWEKNHVGSCDDPGICVSGVGMATVTDGGLYLRFRLSDVDSDLIVKIVTETARKELAKLAAG